MRVIVLAVFVLLVLASCDRAPLDVDGTDLSEYPRMFVKNGSFDGAIVIDDRASDEDRASAALLAASLDASERIREYPRFNAIFETDSILVGSCSQEPPNRFVNLWVDCLSMREDQAIIRITETEGSWVLVIVGDTEVDTRRAVEALIDGDPRIAGEDVEVRLVDETTVIGEPT